MKALIIMDDKFTYDDFKIDEIEEGSVLVEVKACGICGSDIPRILEGKTHFKPMIVGHEASGVVRVSKSSKFNPDDRVIIVPLIPCNNCEECKAGNYARCKKYKFIGSSKYGAMAEYCVVAENNLIKIDEELSYTAAACIEPITIGLHAIYRINNPKKNKKVLIIGCGTIGLFLLQTLKALGFENVSIADIDDEKLLLGTRLGAFKIYNTSKTDIHDKFTYIFETTGANVIQSKVTRFANPGGYIVLVGTVNQDVCFHSKDFEDILRKELFITGAWMSYSSPFPGKEWMTAIKLLKNEKINTEIMITHKFFMSEGKEAVNTMIDRNIMSLKVMLLNK